MMAQIMATYTPTGGISVFPSDQVVEDAILALEGLSTATAYPTAPQTPSPSAPAPPTQSSAGDAGTCRAVEGVVSCGRATGMEQEKGAGGVMGGTFLVGISIAFLVYVGIKAVRVVRRMCCWLGEPSYTDSVPVHVQNALQNAVLGTALGLAMLKWFGSLSGPALVRAIQESFNKFDKDASGLLDRQEFEEAMHTLGLRMKPHELATLWQETDIDCSGTIDLKEYTLMVKKYLNIEGGAHEWRPSRPPAVDEGEGRDGWVRREVLEHVKLKAKQDLADLERELLSVLLVMEQEREGESESDAAVSAQGKETLGDS